MYQAYCKVATGNGCEQVGTGWLPPMPDLRDYTDQHAEIAGMAKKLKVTAAAPALPATVDLSSFCSPIENQMGLGSCTAHAAMGVVEYFERRAFGKHIDGSRLFVYKTTRNLMKVTGDTGAWLRFTMGALALCGVPEEQYWPYTDGPAFDNEPGGFVYAVADNFEALKYFCHDPIGAGVAKPALLASIKKYLAAGVPSMFGFFGFPSSKDTNVIGAFPFPCPGERAIWGHAVVAIGYDDALKITNTRCNKTTTGAFKIRNSWGATWGNAGYGWLPYEYVLQGCAIDFWSLLKMEWVDTKQFGL
ncbi:C1A family cysteine protease [Chitinivorax tropicus]|uniref:C1A family cysteine protease n=1 Tax=Chitinivorax tropicus TaxID=714531 RepID=A0A840MQS8_9PROT|nr:C1 family peptidase [Chitinivorax tropicus]MBB5019132.1 C1A family cysteine protease [Chitinivorax tropicus]